MSTPSEIIIHRGKKIFFSDYTNLEGETFVKQIELHHRQQLDFISTQHSQILVLTDVSGASGSRQVIGCFKEKTKIVGSHIHKSAVIGVEGIQKLLLNAVNRFSQLNTRAFSTREEALDWLTT